MSRTTAIKNEHGDPRWIGPGANAQDGTLKLYRCNTCGGEVVWATSARTGRMYLCDVFTSANGSRYYVKASAHECKSTPESRAALAALEIEHEAAKFNYMQAFTAMQQDKKAGTLDPDTIESRLAELDELSDAIDALRLQIKALS